MATWNPIETAQPYSADDLLVLYVDRRGVKRVTAALLTGNFWFLRNGEGLIQTPSDRLLGWQHMPSPE